MFLGILIRRLKPGKTFEDFLDAWRPEFEGEKTIKVTFAKNIENDGEIMNYCYLDLDRTALDAELKRIADVSGNRRERLKEIVEETVLHGAYEIIGEEEIKL